MAFTFDGCCGDQIYADQQLVMKSGRQRLRKMGYLTGTFNQRAEYSISTGCPAVCERSQRYAWYESSSARNWGYTLTLLEENTERRDTSAHGPCPSRVISQVALKKIVLW